MKNFARLARGRGIAAVLELLTVAILARSLSPDDFGQIVLVQTYVLIVRGFFNFRLFEAVIRFGVPAVEAGDHRSFRRLLRLTLFVDITSSVVSTVIALLAVPLVARFLQWDQVLINSAMIYSSVLLTMSVGTPKGILRLFDRFDLLGVQLMVSPVLRLLGVVVGVALHLDFILLVVILALGTQAGNVYLIVRGWKEFRQQVGGYIIRGPGLKGWQAEFPGLRNFLGIIYAQANVDMVPKHLSTLLAGVMLGPAGAGMLRLAREATKIISKPGALLQQVLFPDLVRLWNRGAISFHVLLLRALTISGLVGLVFIYASIFGGRLLFIEALGPGYAQAAPLMTLLLLSATLDLATFILRAAGYAIGHAGQILKLHLISAVIYLLAFVALIPHFDLLGPGIAACIAATVTLVGVSLLIVRSLQERQLQAD